MNIGDNMSGCGCANKKKAEEKKFTRNAEYQYKGNDICLNGRSVYVQNEVQKTSVMVGLVCAIGAGMVIRNRMDVSSMATFGYAGVAGLLTYGSSKGMNAGSKGANSRYDKLCEKDDETMNDEGGSQEQEESYMDESSPYVSRS